MPVDEDQLKRKWEAEKDLDEIERDTEWKKQLDMLEQAKFLRGEYGRLLLMLEKAEGEMARGTLMLACNILLSGAERIEEQFGQRIMDETERKK